MTEPCDWYLIHTKVRQERCAQENLERQGYTCFLPQIRAEKLRRRALVVVQEPLFPRYLFIRLDAGLEARAGGPIRSTFGVTRLVTFGNQPAKVSDVLVVADGPFIGLEAIYQSRKDVGAAMRGQN